MLFCEQVSEQNTADVTAASSLMKIDSHDNR